MICRGGVEKRWLIGSDLVFILDCTGSMQKYIDATRDHVVGICDNIKREEGLGGEDDLRVAVSPSVCVELVWTWTNTFWGNQGTCRMSMSL